MNYVDYLKRVLRSVAALILVSCQVSAEVVDDATDFGGKTIEFIVPYAVGGGTDSWARAVLPYLKDYLPGQPDILIKNEPGGNATKAANLYAKEAAPDGLSILVTAASNQITYLMQDSRVRYDFDQWRALAAYRAGVIVYTSPEMGVRNIKELLHKEDKNLVLAGVSPTSDDLFVLLAFDLLGIDVSSIFGARGRGPARKTYQRGEANIDFQTTVAYTAHVRPLEEAGQAIPLFTLGAFDQDLNYVRDPLFPDLPNLAEVYESVHGEAPSGEIWQAWFSLYRAGLGSLKLLIVPENTPDAIIQSYEDAITRLNNDQAFSDAVADQVGQQGIIGAKDSEKLLKMRTNLPEDTRQWIKDWIFEHYKVRL